MAFHGKAIAFSGQQLVPVLVDGETVVSDSWEIARYLERKYSDQPSLFGGASGEGAASFVKFWCEGILHPAMMHIIVTDIYARLHDKDKTYFRETREAKWGCSLESFALPPAESISLLRLTLAPLRAMLQRQPFIAGTQPMFADYIVFGVFQFARSMSPLKLLEPDDPVYQWRGRLLDAFSGFARQAVGYDV
jgi:glutathione S-transferase